MALCALFILCGIFQRVFLWPATALWPRKRTRLMSLFMRRVAAAVLFLVEMGGARLRRVGFIPTDAPVLIIMNHQSLLDIPTSILLCGPYVPWFVTRRRYARLIPMVSLMLRILRGPFVDPAADPRGAVAALKEAALTQEHGILIFPEGHRSRDGELGPFETAGLRVLLRTRKTPVYLAVSEGFWVCRTFFDFVFNMHKIRGTTTILGPIEMADPKDDTRRSIDQMRGMVAEHLGAKRAASSHAGLREVLRDEALRHTQDPRADALARTIVASGRESVLGVLFFGSRKTLAEPDPWSAYDLFVVTRDYLSFYGGTSRAGIVRRRPLVLSALNALLPPNQVSISSPGSSGEQPARGKCAVISLKAFVRETSGSRRDHFCVARLFQPNELLYAASPEVEDQFVAGLLGAHVSTYTWARPWLPETFDVDAYCRTLLRVSLRSEIRPEPADRAEALFQAEAPYMRKVFSLLLRDLAGEGELIENKGKYSLAQSVRLGERLRTELYFRWSLLRATLRWAKYMITFEDWLNYILRKAERHTGSHILLKPMERRLPLIFLWPRLFRYLREKERPRAGGRTE